jgi:PBSX family phage terminase large subunit
MLQTPPLLRQFRRDSTSLLVQFISNGLSTGDTEVIDRPPVYERQQQFIEDRHNFAAFIGGIGSGKTWSGAIKTLEFALSKPCVGMVTAPTYNVLRDATVPTFREVAGEHITEITNSSPINATLSNGSRILFRSAHKPELLRGPSLSFWWGDEAALYDKNVLKIMQGRLRQGGRLGYAWLTTTPKGRNWIYQEFIQKARERYAIYKAKTSDNTFIDPDYYEMLAESYTGDFARQELDGDFVAFEGLIYPFFDRDIHITTQTRPTQWAMVAAGVDWGFANPGVIVVYGVDSDGRMWGLHEEYARRRRVEEWAELAKQLEQQYKIDYFFCDPAEPDNISQFQMLGVNAVPAENEVWLGIQSVQNRLTVQGDGLSRLILSPEFVNTAAEFEQYQWAEHKDGLHDKPKKVNDHTMDATRYASVGVDAMFGMGDGGELQQGSSDEGFSNSAY